MARRLPDDRGRLVSSRGLRLIARDRGGAGSHDSDDARRQSRARSYSHGRRRLFSTRAAASFRLPHGRRRRSRRRPGDPASGGGRRPQYEDRRSDRAQRRWAIARERVGLDRKRARQPAHSRKGRRTRDSRDRDQDVGALSELAKLRGQRRRPSERRQDPDQRNRLQPRRARRTVRQSGQEEN
jgi:hypothetical protein